MHSHHDISLDIEFKENKLLSQLFGERDRYLHRIENQLHVTIRARGNHVNIVGKQHNIAMAQTVLQRLYDRLVSKQGISTSEVDAVIRFAQPESVDHMNSETKESHSDQAIATRKKVITPRTAGQVSYIKMLENHDVVFALGPAGTGKTYLAMAMAVSHLLKGTVNRIILSRPAVEAGEKLGFLPGNLKEKVDPYLRPLYDALHDMMPVDQVDKRIESGEIEVAPLAFMRGRTLSRAYVILDEAQNTTVEQMKMFLTRLGEHSKMVITGDLTQIDLPHGIKSGLIHSINVLKDVSEIGFNHFNEDDVLRHPIVSKIVKAYNRVD